MRLALITGGQPRFTNSFVTLMNQLQGFDTADLYMVFWRTPWALDEDTARRKIEKTLLPRYNLAEVRIVDEPDWQSKLPPCPVPLAPPMNESITWWFKRGYQQFISLSMAFDLINKPYDTYVRFRLDGQLHGPLDLRNIHLSDNVIFPSNSTVGFRDFTINDQFAIGNYNSMKFYCNFGKEYPNLVPYADPLWYNDGVHRADKWTWSAEHVMGTYMKLNNRQRIVGDFQHYINVGGRSRFTDKHYHLPIIHDVTE